MTNLLLMLTSYATIVLDRFFNQRLKNPESIEPIFFTGGVSGFTRPFIATVNMEV